MGVRKVSNSKSDLQGHWYCCRSTWHIQFPISLQLQLWLYLAVISQNLKRSCDPEHIPVKGNLIIHARALVLFSSSQHDKFEIFTHAKDIIGSQNLKKKTAHMTLNIFSGGLSSMARS